jgi:hypothetical protein
LIEVLRLLVSGSQQRDFSLNYVVNDNIMMRTSFSSNVFGNSDVDNSVLRLQFGYGWNHSSENAKKLLSH